MNSRYLVGDGIENPHNAQSLMSVAQCFGLQPTFRNTQKLLAAWPDSAPLPTIDGGDIDMILPAIAIENSAGARSIFESRLPATTTSVVVGNERRGIRGDLLNLVDQCVSIPVQGRTINTLNVTAAAGVGLYYLMGSRPLGMRVRRRPDEARPAVLLLNPKDHVETGSSIRSAAAFGWQSICVADAHDIWFSAERWRKNEGRAAARSHRNPVRILRVEPTRPLRFRRVIVVQPSSHHSPLERVDLAGGADTTIVITDADQPVGVNDAAWIGDDVEFAAVRPELASAPYRVVASIALAEAMRQVGSAPAGHRQRPRRGMTYESRLAARLPNADLELTRNELEQY